MASKTYGNVVFGLRDIKITDIGDTVQEDLGASQTMAVQPMYVGGNLDGDDAVKAVISFITHAEGEFSAGHYSSAAVAIMLGTSLTIGGTTPNETVELIITEGLNMPYFKLYGQAMDDGAGSLNVEMHKVKLTSFEAVGLENGEFRVTTAEVTAVDDGVSGVMKITQYETATDLPAAP